MNIQKLLGSYVTVELTKVIIHHVYVLKGGSFIWMFSVPAGPWSTMFLSIFQMEMVREYYLII